MPKLPPPDEIPRHELLLRRVAASNTAADAFLGLSVAAAVFVALVIDWGVVVANPGYALLACAIVLGGFLQSGLETLFRKKLKVENLREDRPLGMYTRDRLVSLVEEVRSSLGLPDDKLPVYIVREKTYNGFAVHYGLGRLIPSLNGVYLNRQVLHLLQPDELKSLIGHEFGHYYRHPLKWSRNYPLYLLCCCVFAIGTFVWLGGSGLSWFAVLAVAFGYGFIINAAAGARSKDLEFLCDHVGAEASGLLPAVNDLLKGGRESEIYSRLQIQLLDMARKGNRASPEEVMKLYEEAVPFGKIDEARVKAAVAAGAADKQGPTVGGFFKEMWGGGVDEDELEEAITVGRVMEQLPKIVWPAEAGALLDRGLSMAQVAALVSALEANPDKLLFALETEIPGQKLTHPSFRDRILYLWKHREMLPAGAAAT